MRRPARCTRPHPAPALARAPPPPSQLASHVPFRPTQHAARRGCLALLRRCTAEGYPATDRTLLKVN